VNWLPSLLAACVTAVVGLLTAGFVASACTGWYHISPREGAAGYFVAGVALAGAVASLVFGLIVARAAPGLARAVLLSSGAVVLAGGLGAVVAWLLADIPPTIDGHELRLEVEIRLPVDQRVPPAEIAGAPEFLLGSVVNQTRRAAEAGALKVAAARHDDGRWIVPAEARLFTSRGRRVIEARVGDALLAAFEVPLPARPGEEYEQWSGWFPQPPAGAPPWPDTRASFRFRVQRDAPSAAR
jgi:hypothetical protein